MNNEDREIIDIEKETLHSSWIQNMIQMITIGIVLITFFRPHKNLRKYTFIPIIIIILGIVVGIYSIIYSYYFTSQLRIYYTWQYLSIVICIIFSFIGLYIVRYFRT